jgi:hypothetical protein
MYRSPCSLDDHHIDLIVIDAFCGNAVTGFCKRIAHFTLTLREEIPIVRRDNNLSIK